MDDEKLISEVEQRQILYDALNVFYKDNSRKEKAWEEVATAMGVTVDVCRARWKALRDAFVKSRKKTDAPNGSAEGSQREWKYAGLMSFILPHLQQRSSKSDLGPRAGEGGQLAPGQEVGAAEGPCQSVSAEGSPSPSAPALQSVPSEQVEHKRVSKSQRPRGPKSKRRRAEGEGQSGDFEERLLAILQEPAPEPQRPQSELDESYHFAMSLVPMLHRLDEHKRGWAKIEILTILQKLLNEQSGDTGPGPGDTTYM